MKQELKLMQNQAEILTQSRDPIENEELWTNTNKILYGPVASRRLGESLGINFYPEQKVCSYNCVYCDVGLTSYKNQKYIKAEKIIEIFEIEIIELQSKYNNNNIPIDYFTFCGNGENLDHPDFHRIYHYINNRLKDYFPNIPVAILTNGINMSANKNVEIINSMDINFIKLDAGDKETFNRINRPRDKNSWNLIINNLKKIRNLRIETAVVHSNLFSNISSLKSSYINLINTFEKIGNLRGLYLHNLDYPTPYKEIKYNTLEEIKEIADFISERVNTAVYVLHSKINFRE